MPSIFCETPLGIAKITETDGCISSISIADHITDDEQLPTELLAIATQQLNDYFTGSLRRFNLPIKQTGTDFQQLVWAQLMDVEYGQTITYTQQANRMKNPLAIRAIAAANGKNSLWIVVPCHRIIGINGALTGYAGGLWRKKWLLEHEAKITGRGQIQLDF